MLRVALAQINSTVGDLNGNRAKILKNVERAKDLQADIVVFPELSLCGYPPEDLLYKASFIQDNLKTLALLVKDIKGIATISAC